MKISRKYQEKYRGDKQFYNEHIRTFEGISANVKLHDHIDNPMSSATSCLNVLGYLNQNKDEIIPFFKNFGVEIDEVIEFPSGVNYGGEVYDDVGPIVFEWIGPKVSSIEEGDIGGRGDKRTSVDAFFLAKINGKATQILVEWKFTEKFNKYHPDDYLHKFGGLKGVERAKRYSAVLARQKEEKTFPFCFSKKDDIGLFDFSYDPFCQLLRITLLAKETTPTTLGDLKIENYLVLHLVHSENHKLLNVEKTHLKYSPGLLNRNLAGGNLHEIWQSLLTEKEKTHFFFGHWDKALKDLKDPTNYLKERYMQEA